MLSSCSLNQLKNPSNLLQAKNSDNNDQEQQNHITFLPQKRAKKAKHTQGFAKQILASPEIHK